MTRGTGIEREVKVHGSRIPLSALIAVARHGAQVSVSDSVRDVVAKAHQIVLNRLTTGELAYGVNTGLGPARNDAIPTDLLDVFQEQIISSHAASLGAPMTRYEARATIFARLVGISHGGAGASNVLFSGLEQLLNENVTPIIPVNGSVGAADLVQMAAIGNVLLGRGRVMSPDGESSVTTGVAFAEHGLKPIALAPKDALALIGANAASLGMGALLVRDLGHLLGNGDVVAALSVTAMRANDSVFAEKLMAARPLPGQIGSAARVRAALEPIEGLTLDDLGPRSVQDPLSIRTVPQVHGAAVDQLQHVSNTLELELNSRAENPLIFVETGEIISNGNFSIIGLAIGFEATRLAITHVGMLIERRIAMLAKSLRTAEGIAEQLRRRRWRSHYMAPILLQNTASATVAELKHLAAPVTVMGTSVADGVEDHNSMAYSAISLTKRAMELVRTLQAIEALMATSVLAVSDAPKPIGAGTRRLFDIVSACTEAADGDTLTDTIISGVVAELGVTCLTGLCLGDEIFYDNSDQSVGFPEV